MTSTFTGTCISLHLACVQEFSLENKLTEAVRLFLNSPEDRFKHKLPNLYTMIGYVLSLPANNVMPLLGNMFNNYAFFFCTVHVSQLTNVIPVLLIPN